MPFVQKHAWTAYHGEHLKKTAARMYSRAVIAHVRQATIRPTRPVNTHPIVHGVWLFAHNGVLLQVLGYFGRCRFDSILIGHDIMRAELH